MSSDRCRDPRNGIGIWKKITNIDSFWCNSLLKNASFKKKTNGQWLQETSTSTALQFAYAIAPTKRRATLLYISELEKKTQFKIVTAKEDLQFLDVLFHAFWLHRVNWTQNKIARNESSEDIRCVQSVGSLTAHLLLQTEWQFCLQATCRFQ